LSAAEPMSDKRRRPASVAELLTVDEVADLLRLSRSKVYELVASRTLPAYRPGGRIRVPAEAVRDYLGRSRV